MECPEVEVAAQALIDEPVSKPVDLKCVRLPTRAAVLYRYHTLIPVSTRGQV